MNHTEVQFFNAYKLGMGFLFPYFTKVTSDTNKFNFFEKEFEANRNYFLESNNLDILLQASSFIVHKNTYTSCETGFPNFKGFTYRSYKKLMDDMMSSECGGEYRLARDNDILIVYFPAESRDLTKIIDCLYPILTCRDSEEHINIILTTNLDLRKHFKFEDMTDKGRPIFKTLSYGSMAKSNVTTSTTGNANGKEVF